MLPVSSKKVVSVPVTVAWTVTGNEHRSARTAVSVELMSSLVGSAAAAVWANAAVASTAAATPDRNLRIRILPFLAFSERVSTRLRRFPGTCAGRYPGKCANVSQRLAVDERRVILAVRDHLTGVTV